MDKQNIIYGKNSIIEAILSGERQINKILISKSTHCDSKTQEIINLARSKGIIFQFVPKEKFTLYSEYPHQGVIAQISPVKYKDLDEFLDDNNEFKSVVILDGVEDPHNVVAIIRTAVCAGYDAVILPSRRNAQVNATVEKSSAGAINHIAIIQVNSLSSTIEKLKKHNYWIIAADAQGKDNYFDIDYCNMSFALIMGGEETGVSKNNLNKSDFIVKIPMLRNFNSLNVSNAASAIIYESVRQKLQTKKDSV